MLVSEFLPVRELPHLSPLNCWDRLQHIPVTQNVDTQVQKTDGWMIERVSLAAEARDLCSMYLVKEDDRKVILYSTGRI